MSTKIRQACKIDLNIRRIFAEMHLQAFGKKRHLSKDNTKGIFTRIKASSFGVFLLLDGYGNFANDALMGGLSKKRMAIRAVDRGRGDVENVPLGQHGLSGEQIRTMSTEELESLPLVEKAFADSKKQLADYCRTLGKAYGGRLRLNGFAVVAVGYEKLVWEKYQH